ncbi:hypothetical protein CRE_25028 [Caenorhabditis remanei]|uniref:Uncharacterized protein n=1 Tax=Caenorhabditis remanei TaxID=31234 RepID=E3NU93_CAERE|nr:hypothetical protein CRE_25028 [Caenorhabditis remanei]
MGTGATNGSTVSVIFAFFGYGGFCADSGGDGAEGEPAARPVGSERFDDGDLVALAHAGAVRDLEQAEQVDRSAIGIGSAGERVGEIEALAEPGDVGFQLGVSGTAPGSGVDVLELRLAFGLPQRRGRCGRPDVAERLPHVADARDGEPAQGFDTIAGLGVPGPVLVRGESGLERGHAVVDEAAEVVAFDAPGLHLADRVPLEGVVGTQALAGLVHAAVELERGPPADRQEQEGDGLAVDVARPDRRVLAEHGAGVVVVGVLVQAEVGACAGGSVDLEAFLELLGGLDAADLDRLLALRLAHVLAVLLRHIAHELVLAAREVEDQRASGQHRRLGAAPARREREASVVLVGLDRDRDRAPRAPHVVRNGVGDRAGRRILRRSSGGPGSRTFDLGGLRAAREHRTAAGAGARRGR